LASIRSSPSSKLTSCILGIPGLCHRGRWVHGSPRFNRQARQEQQQAKEQQGLLLSG